MIWLSGGLGLVILLLAGDALVKGAVNLSLRAGIPAFIVSLTIVAFGTSAPELLISVNAALDNDPGIALGNVVGSNTANILLVLGVPALISVIRTSGCEIRSSYLQMIGATAIFIALAHRGVFDWMAGLLLLALLFGILGLAVVEGLRRRQEANDVVDEEEPEGADSAMPSWKISLFLGLGIVGLPLGADLMVNSAEQIAHLFGVSEAAIGLTLVALGTSLPELATTVMAVRRGQADVALGNVVGSNLFNLLAIVGITTLIVPIDVDPSFLSRDLWVMAAASLLLIPFLFFSRDLTRFWGVILSALYLGYIALIFS